MKRFLTLVLMLCVALPAMAQSGRVVAKVIDMETKDGIIGAIVEVTSKKNANYRKHNTTGAGGSVTISGLPAGDYTMTISFIGYTSINRDVTVSGTTDLGTIELAPGVAIEAVVKEVQALRTSQNGDTLAYNAAAFKVAADADVEGLLKKMPGITITNGSVEAQGEQVKKIFVDGKEFFGEDVSTALNSLPAQAVERIEVFNKLSDNAEFSGMDDGEGYKAINIITRSNMRQGVFGKLYAGYGYQPDIDGGAPTDMEFQNGAIYIPVVGDVTSHHKYNLGGNVNIFHGNHRVSVIGLLNNVNQQNFSFEDIIGVSGGGGGGHRGRGVGQYMVRPQSGVANVGSIGTQYTGTWGEKDAIKLNGSYFFNDTRTRNKSLVKKWYEIPSPDDDLVQEGESESHNFNHRFNVRFDWNINENMSLMSRTNFSLQGNDSYSQQYGELTGETPQSKGLPYETLHNGSDGLSRAFRFSEFLQYRLKLGKPGRTITLDGRYSVRNTPRSWTHSYSTLSTLYDAESAMCLPDLRYVSSLAPQGETDIRANFTYTEPVSKNSQVSFQYRFDYEDQFIEKSAYVTGNDYNITGLVPDPDLSSFTNSLSMEHRVGPGFRYAKGRNTFITNIYYQYSTLNGMINGKDVKRDFNDLTYFVMGNVAFNPQNSIRVFINSYTHNPDVRNLQDIYDVSNAQYISKGNPELRSSYNHRINFHYVRSNIEKGRTFMWMFSGQITQRYIGQKITYNPESITVGDKVYNPLQFTEYANMNGSSSLRTHLSYGFPIAPIKCNLNVMVGYNWNRTPSMINDELNITSNMGYDATVSLGSNISENIDFTLQWNGAYNNATQSLAQRNGRNEYFNHTASGTLKWVFWRGFTFTAAVTYNQYIGFTNDYNEDYLLCNVYLGKKLFKNKQGELLIGVNDLLNQNTAFARTVGSGFTQNSWNSVIGRYFTVQFNYNLRYFGKRGSTNIDDYEGMGGSGGKRPAFGPPMHH
ncbi:MAG: outer membrane beta-barrel protein [Alistipes sp.]|nr:outer membrane beta-barrel protein [Alistipes sp.]